MAAVKKIGRGKRWHDAKKWSLANQSEIPSDFSDEAQATLRALVFCRNNFGPSDYPSFGETLGDAQMVSHGRSDNRWRMRPLSWLAVHGMDKASWYGRPWK